ARVRVAVRLDRPASAADLDEIGAWPATVSARCRARRGIRPAGRRALAGAGAELRRGARSRRRVPGLAVRLVPPWLRLPRLERGPRSGGPPAGGRPARGLRRRAGRS